MSQQLPKKTFVVLFLILLLGILTGCGPNSERFDERPANFWDGIWHGIISPFYFFDLPDPPQATNAYNTGIWIGIGWIALFAIGGASEDNKENGGCVGGCLLGILMGATIYWPIYIIVYLISSVIAWVGWLVNSSGG